MSKRIAIVGGGASGILCAIFCAKNGWHVDLFEQNDKCGKKILVSGNGRCNISNQNLSVDKFLGTNPHFVSHAINRFDFKKFEDFTNSLGLLLTKKEDGRAYPLSQEAKSVVALFLEHAKELGVNIYINNKITNPKELFNKYDVLVIATGSEAASHLGGCDDGYKFAQSFGHSIIPTFASLVQLHLTSPLLKKIAGAKVEGSVTLFRNRQKDITTYGDILFASYGISGFAILDISHHASFALSQFEDVEISLNLLPQFTAQLLSTHIATLVKQRENLKIFEILQGLLPSKIALGLLEYLLIDKDIELKNIDTKTIKKIVHTMQNWRFSVSDTHGFRHAEVSGGGVNTDEINPKTFESKLKKNLYFCGEVLDITGVRGGYNFAFAWASAYVAAKAIDSSLKSLS